jgi:hypothetical protein
MSGVRAERLGARALRQVADEAGMPETDPVATAASRPLTLITSMTSLAVAGSLTVVHPGHLERPAVMAAAFIFLAATCLFLIRGSNEMRGSFTTQKHIVVVLLSWTAASLSTFAQWPNNEYLRDDWGPYIVAITLIATSPYRPLGSLLAALGTSALFVAGLAVWQTPAMSTALPNSAFALLAAAPVVLLATAGIVYARVDVFEHAARVTDRPELGAEAEPVELTTQEKRVMLLTGEVAPLFSWVVQRRTITADDVEHAAAISAAVRATMVHGANQSWIACATAEAIESAQSSVTRPAHAAARSVAQILVATRVWDASDLSGRMSFEQRTAVRALLEVMFEHDQVRPESFAARVLRHGHDVQLWIDVSYGLGERGAMRPATPPRAWHLRKPLGPFVAVARASFLSVDFTTYSTKESLKVTLRFSYGL